MNNENKLTEGTQKRAVEAVSIAVIIMICAVAFAELDSWVFPNRQPDEPLKGWYAFGGPGGGK